MHHTFRILRNNKESGPLSLEELLKLSLQPYDLIWVEGKSAAWSYPSEIDLLKPYLNPEEEEETMQLIHPASENLRTVSSQIINTSLPHAENEEGMTAEKLEEKAERIYRRIQAYTKQCEEQEQETQTNYARSLDDLKQEYADWLHKKKTKRKFIAGKLIYPLAVATLCLISLLYFLNQRSAADPLQKKLTAAEKTLTPKSLSGIEKEKITTASKTVYTKDLSVDRFIDSIERLMKKSDAGLNSLKVYTRKTNTLLTSSGSSASSAMSHEAKNQPTITPNITTDPMLPLSSLVNLDARYIYQPNKEKISALEITIHNKSAQLLKTVSVDIFYYKKRKKLFDKETIYFNNLMAGSSMTLSVPGNKKAASAQFQLGQISAGN